MISKKRERFGKSQSDSKLFSISTIAGTRAEDDGNFAQGIWSKSYGWSRSRSRREHNLKYSLTENNWSFSARDRFQRTGLEKFHLANLGK